MQQEKATFAAGCFWGVEAAFREVPGVIDTLVGYTGGTTTDPTYEEVCTDTTGHAEAVQVTYDPTHVSYQTLVAQFFSIHDPTQRDGQGLDSGRQYRSALFFHDEKQRAVAEDIRQTLADLGRYGEREIVTEILPAGAFYPAEEYHQRYLEKRGSGHS